MITTPDCAFCKHYSGEGRCSAFPDGIPAKIIEGLAGHQRPYPGDHGIVFEIKPGLPESIARTFASPVAEALRKAS